MNVELLDHWLTGPVLSAGVDRLMVMVGMEWRVRNCSWLNTFSKFNVAAPILLLTRTLLGFCEYLVQAKSLVIYYSN